MALLKSVILTVLIAFSFSSCSNSTMRIMATWVSPDIPKAEPGKHLVFIMVMTQNYEVQVHLENDLAAAAKEKGIKTIMSTYAFGPILSHDQLPKKEAILKAIRDLGCDIIFTTALVDKKSETHYVPASSTSVYTPYAGYGYYYSGYYAYSPTFYTPGYYSTDHTYFVESNLFDAKSEKMLMSMQSKLENPGDIEKESANYTRMLVTELQAHGY